jgi:hypothetical protein
MCLGTLPARYGCLRRMCALGRRTGRLVRMNVLMYRLAVFFMSGGARRRRYRLRMLRFSWERDARRRAGRLRIQPLRQIRVSSQVWTGRLCCVVRKRYRSWLCLQGLFADSYCSEPEIAIRRRIMREVLEEMGLVSVFHPRDSMRFRSEVLRGSATLFDFEYDLEAEYFGIIDCLKDPYRWDDYHNCATFLLASLSRSLAASNLDYIRSIWARAVCSFSRLPPSADLLLQATIPSGLTRTAPLLSTPDS